MPVVGVGFAVERDVVDPHVEVRPVDADEEHKTPEAGIATGSWENEAHANGDFHDAGDEHPDGWVAQDCRDDGFEPGGVGKMLDADIDVHASKDNGKHG